ncbi:hypothetical protein EW146_g6604 [Bondarzewia mesenterica]|uniref:YVC1 N-terminal linker helical domain-containing protein n=1 Tax=Bondarzewia mesenterica TaxID=1095465 RepID=A0A4V3XEH3_9AGAM|nr:hypothetical protein EW146_g6604 [Bondarzewia mesenterica]
MSSSAFIDESASVTSVKSVRPSSDTLAKLIRRLRALTLSLLPLEVSPDSINDPTSRVITPQVISAYIAAAGDFYEAVSTTLFSENTPTSSILFNSRRRAFVRKLPYCLLRAHRGFMLDAHHDPADYGENLGRAAACEVLARKIVHIAPRERLSSIMSTRFEYRQADGDIEMTSALEIAIDSHCTIFLSSSEAQDVVNYLWNGDLIQKNNDHHDIDYVPYNENLNSSFWGHLDPSRMAVPRYQNFMRIAIWLFFLAVYSQAVLEPLDPMDPFHRRLDNWEIVLYVMSLAFALEDGHKIYKLLHFATYRALSFWNIVSFSTDILLICAFILRVVGLANGTHGDTLQLVTVFDGYKYIGTMQICIARMLRESSIFFALLSVLGIGFLQGLYALDAADGQTDSAMTVKLTSHETLRLLTNYVFTMHSPAGLMLFYLWNVVTAIILLNVLISLFSSAYSDIVEDAEAEFLAYFAGKTVSLIRTPDSFVYPAPFNLIETFFIAPFEYAPDLSLLIPVHSFSALDRHVFNSSSYATINRYIMTVLFFIPLSLIALFESTKSQRNQWLNEYMNGSVDEDDSPEVRDPLVDGEDAEQGLRISKVPFSELIKVFPNTHESSEATITREIHQVKAQLDTLMKMLEKS